MKSFLILFVTTFIITLSITIGEDPDSVRGLNPSAPPVIPPDGRCYFKEDCSSDEYCEPKQDPDLLGTCVAKLKVGADCSKVTPASLACEDGSYCESTPPPGATSNAITCKKKGKEGEKCDPNFGNDSCLDGLVCRVGNNGNDDDVCGQAAKEGEKCRSLGCGKGLYCDENGFVGTCKKKVPIGGRCNDFQCCVDEAYQLTSDVCLKRMEEGEPCSGGDDSCMKGLKCNGDELQEPNRNSPPRCVKESDLIREGGKECDIARDNCDDSRFLACRKRGEKSLCIFELPAGPCNPGAKFEVCLDNKDSPGGPFKGKCLEIIEGGKKTGEFACKQVKDDGRPIQTPASGPTSTPSYTPSTSARPREPACPHGKDPKRKILNVGNIAKSSARKWKKKKGKLRCVKCHKATGRYKGGCRGKHCYRGGCA